MGTDNALRAGKFRAASAFFIVLAFAAVPARATDVLPPVFVQCPLPQSVFNTWFQSGTAAPNGFVNPANSITFTPTSNCDFYKWSEQMWLWATSPAPSIYGGGGRVFTSSLFYNVSPPDPNNSDMRTLSSNVIGPAIGNTALTQAARSGLPLIIDTQGNPLQVFTARAAPDGNSMIRNGAGHYVEIGRIQTSKNGKVTFYDTASIKIDATVRPYYELLPLTITGPLDALAVAEAKAHGKSEQSFRAELIGNLMSELSRTPLVERFTINGVHNFVTTLNRAAIPEVGQADTGVLITQTNHLVVYNIDVNDVYAYYLTGRKRVSAPNLPPLYNAPDTAPFPTTQTDLNAIQTAFSKTFTDGIALAIELKTSWVQASSLPDPQDYILRNVNVPTYTVTNANLWQRTGQSQVQQMALLGMHIAGSTKGHREMIWGTYEHVNNSPHAAFYWMDQTGPSGPGSHHLELANTGANTPPWLFYNPASTGAFACPNLMTSSCNVPQATLQMNGDITGNPIGPSSVIRAMAFGSTANQPPNPVANSMETSDDEIISLNNQIQTMLSGDVRSNYVFTGSTWTENGALPTGRFDGVSTTANEVGASALANSTMETFQQGPTALAFNAVNAPQGNPHPVNCFECHQNGSTAPINTTDVSHIFKNIIPLF